MVLDFSDLNPSDALARAHEAFPGIRWEWNRPTVGAFGTGCAVALLAFAMGLEDLGDTRQWDEVGAHFAPRVRPHFPETEWSFFNVAAKISVLTIRAHSFPEAVAALREAGI